MGFRIRVFESNPLHKGLGLRVQSELEYPPAMEYRTTLPKRGLKTLSSFHNRIRLFCGSMLVCGGKVCNAGQMGSSSNWGKGKIITFS